MFKPLWRHGRAICFADGWFEWKKEGDKKQPYFIHRADGQPIFMAAIGSTPFERGDESEGFLIVTSAADKGLVDIHDRRPLVLSAVAAREWMRQDVGGKEAQEIAADGAVPTDKFIWHAVARDVGNGKNQGRKLIEQADIYSAVLLMRTLYLAQYYLTLRKKYICSHRTTKSIYTIKFNTNTWL